jgi:hypothetical protein
MRLDEQNLVAALSSYDWNGARAICDRMIRRTLEESEPCPLDHARVVLTALRRKRRFELMTRVAEAFVFSGQDGSRTRRQYAQALIDSGLLMAAEPILQAITVESLENDSQVMEAHGLLGRIFKERYVKADRPDNRYARAAFERSLAEYLQTYRLNPSRNYWHGVNVVALLHRGKVDGIPIVHAPDPDALAREILETLRNAEETMDAFALATRAEALLALRNYRGAEEALLEYSQHKDTDAFEAASTLRQFEEIWRLRDDTPPGDTLLPVLRATTMHGEHGALQSPSADIRNEIATVQKAQTRLEANFGYDKTVTLKWYLMGLERAKSIARIERADGKGIGTGWLVRAEDFFNDRHGLVLLTNAHVISAAGGGGVLRPYQAIANFQVLQKTFTLEDQVIWSSPPSSLDATFVAFKGAVPEADPMPVSMHPVELETPAQRVYIMGHPDGRNLELSLHDNKLVSCIEHYLHYRTPTEKGSSGSPVFEHTAWLVVALHHAGEPSADASGKKLAYEANEGIAIAALRAATAI